MRLSATKEGLSWENHLNNKNGLPKLYYSPPKLVFNGEIFFSMVKKYVETHRAKTEIMAERPNGVGLFLICALARMFPANNNKGQTATIGSMGKL